MNDAILNNVLRLSIMVLQYVFVGLVVRNPEKKFSCDAAHLFFCLIQVFIFTGLEWFKDVPVVTFSRFEQPLEKTNNVQMRDQKWRSAVQLLHSRSTPLFSLQG